MGVKSGVPEVEQLQKTLHSKKNKNRQDPTKFHASNSIYAKKEPSCSLYTCVIYSRDPSSSTCLLMTFTIALASPHFSTRCGGEVEITIWNLTMPTSSRTPSNGPNWPSPCWARRCAMCTEAARKDVSTSAGGRESGCPGGQSSPCLGWKVR